MYTRYAILHENAVKNKLLFYKKAKERLEKQRTQL